MILLKRDSGNIEIIILHQSLPIQKFIIYLNRKNIIYSSKGEHSRAKKNEVKREQTCREVKRNRCFIVVFL